MAVVDKVIPTGSGGGNSGNPIALDPSITVGEVFPFSRARAGAGQITDQWHHLYRGII